MCPSAVLLLWTGICQMFEEKLKRENPQQKKITYDISDLFSFIDKLTDLAALVSETQHNTGGRRGRAVGSPMRSR